MALPLSRRISSSCATTSNKRLVDTPTISLYVPDKLSRIVPELSQNLASAPKRYETIDFLPSLMKSFKLITRVVGSLRSI